MIRRAVFIAFVFQMSALAVAADEKTKPQAPSDQDDPIGRKLSKRIGPYLQTTPLRSAKRATREAWKRAYKRLTVDEKVHYCIFQLRNEYWWESDCVWSNEPYSREPEGTARRELVKLGRAAMPQLLSALDSRVNTQITPTRWRTWDELHWLVQDAALDTIENIACKCFGGGTQVPKLSDVGDEERQKIRKKVAVWWAQNKGSDELQWAKNALFSYARTYQTWYMAIDSLYHRLGKDSYPFLAKAYHRLPKGRDDVVGFDETKDIKMLILQRLLNAPSTNEKAVFASALQDAPLWIRIDGAEGLWAIGDHSGLDAIVKETEDRLLTDAGRKDAGSMSFYCEYDNLLNFLGRCNTPGSREAIYKCLRGRNPFLRVRAVCAVPSLHMEKAVRALPELFDDQFVVANAYIPGSTASVGSVETKNSPTYTPATGSQATSPATRICDEAAETFTQVVPDSPRFDGTTAETQQSSIDKMKQWWKKNGTSLKWDEKRGMLVRPTKE